MQHLIQDAKLALPMPDLWRKLGWPGEPKKSCRRPYSPEDSRDKGSVFQHYSSGAWLFHDFVSGETFDEVDLLTRMEGLSKGEAIRRHIDLAGIKERGRIRLRLGQDSSKVDLPPVIQSKPPQQIPRRRPGIGKLTPFAPDDVLTLARLRGIDPDAIRLAALDGHLWTAENRGHKCWVWTDSVRWLATYRRMDGGLLRTKEGIEQKVMGPPLYGEPQRKGWPIGFSKVQHIAFCKKEFRSVILVEGGPDFLAAYQAVKEANLVKDCGVLGMVSSTEIEEGLLYAFNGVRVRLFPHLDSSGKGEKIVVRWQEQLESHGAIVDGFDFRGLLRADGKPVEDLNDAMLMDQNERAALGLMEGML